MPSSTSSTSDQGMNPRGSLENQRDFRISNAYYLVFNAFLIYVALHFLIMFGGTIRTDTDFAGNGISATYRMNHANDLLGSMITLYVFMIGNNWYAVRDAFVIKNGKAATISFNVFFLLCDAVLMNILIGYVVGIYDDVT